jgi:hypothetical protein
MDSGTAECMHERGWSYVGPRDTSGGEVMGTDNLVCVGGKADGRRYTVDRASQWIRVPIRTPSTITWEAGEPVVPCEEIRYELYERASVSGAQVLVPQLQRPETTMRLLIDGYAR